VSSASAVDTVPAPCLSTPITKQKLPTAFLAAFVSTLGIPVIGMRLTLPLIKHDFCKSLWTGPNYSTFVKAVFAFSLSGWIIRCAQGKANT
jgi:hypothetical protein